MRVDKPYFEQALVNWALRGERTKTFRMTELKNVSFICTKNKNIARCNAYYVFNHKGRSSAIRIGDFYSEVVEQKTETNPVKFKFNHPVSVNEIVENLRRVQLLGKDKHSILSALKVAFPQKTLKEMLDFRESTTTLSSATKSSKHSVVKKVVAGASNDAKKLVTPIDPIKEVKIKNLEQELELIDLKIRKCEILKEISALKNG